MLLSYPETTLINPINWKVRKNDVTNAVLKLPWYLPFFIAFSRDGWISKLFENRILAMSSNYLTKLRNSQKVKLNHFAELFCCSISSLFSDSSISELRMSFWYDTKTSEINANCANQIYVCNVNIYYYITSFKKV